MDFRLKSRIVALYGSQAAFAKAINEHESAVSQVLRGRRTLNQERQKRWSAALKARPEELFSRKV